MDRKPQSYWTTYLQTPMIGSGAPALRAISHLLRNQIIQYHVTVFRRVYLYGFQTDKVARSLNTTVHHIHAHSGYCLLNHRPTRQLVCEKYITS